MKLFLSAAIHLLFGAVIFLAFCVTIVFGVLYLMDQDPFTGYVALVGLGISAVCGLLLYKSEKLRNAVMEGAGLIAFLPPV